MKNCSPYSPKKVSQVIFVWTLSICQYPYKIVVISRHFQKNILFFLNFEYIGKVLLEPNPNSNQEVHHWDKKVLHCCHIGEQFHLRRHIGLWIELEQPLKVWPYLHYYRKRRKWFTYWSKIWKIVFFKHLPLSAR